MQTIWAKHDKPTGLIHPLHAHLADVAAVVELLLDHTPLGQRLAEAMGCTALSPKQRASLILLAALHDVGKVNHGFQEQIAEKPRFSRRNHHRFLLASMDYDPLADAIDDALKPLGLDEADAVELFHTTVAHHGLPLDATPDIANNVFWKPIAGVRDPVAEIRRLAELALRWSGLAGAEGPPLVVTPALTHLWAGTLTLADWIGSTESLFQFTPDANPEAYWPLARQRAADGCRRIGVAPSSVQLDPDAGTALLALIFPSVFGDRGAAPTRLQEHAATMPLPQPGTRLLIESETGSGKTEAALTLYARLRAAGTVAGMVFALPTRATASAMHRRIKEALAGIYGAGAPAVVLAVGGQGPRTGGSGELAEQPLTYDDDAEGPDPARLWASQGAKRYMAGEIVVATLDQLLLGALPVRHAHMRLAAATRHLLVVDELHSYDRYMTGVLAELLAVHTGHRGIALFMSATLSAGARRELGAAAEPEAGRDEAEERPYPSLSVCRAGEPWRDVHLPSSAAPKQVPWRVCDGTEGLAQAVRAAAGGARVLVLRNTVRGARATVAELREQALSHLLWSPRAGATPAYHSRYAPPDRKWLDEAVLETFGRGTPGGGVILVATQVAEQSLDVDFDLLVTDLCPVDVLLQRIGRLWRHPERTRPACCELATALVLAPEGGMERYLETFYRAGPDGWGTVYPDLGDLELTLGLVCGETSIEIPRDNRRLVEAVYHQDARASLDSDAWRSYRDAREGIEFATVAHARQSVIRFRETYAAGARQFSAAAETKIRTRLGDDQVRVPLTAPVRCRYADDEVDFVDLPEKDVAKAGVFPPVATTTGIEGEYRLGEYVITYGDDGWLWRGESIDPAGAP
jgi:CRISPR-associated endonuclease/helicase Cas3